MGFFSRHEVPVRTKDEIKRLTRVLFIDDNEFDIVLILRQEGWNVECVKDIESFNTQVLLSAHILFIDIRGVGVSLKFEEEGLGLAGAIKKTFPEKLIVVYSSEREGDRFNPVLNAVERTLPKDAEPFRFIQLVEELASVCFTYDKCVERIHSFLEREMGQSVPSHEILSAELKRALKKKYNPQQIASSLSIGLDLAGNVASILSLFAGG